MKTICHNILKKIDNKLITLIGLNNLSPQYIQSNNNNLSIICVRSGDRFCEKKSLNQFLLEKDAISPVLIKKCGKAIGKCLANDLVVEFD